MAQYDDNDEMIPPPMNENSVRGSFLAYLSKHMPTAWHIAAQHSLWSAAQYIAALVHFRFPNPGESPEKFAAALTRFLLVHGYKEEDNELVETRQFHVVH